MVFTQFASVPELVTFYQSVSLREYNRTLDTRLLYPVSRLPFLINGIILCTLFLQVQPTGC